MRNRVGAGQREVIKQLVREGKATIQELYLNYADRKHAKCSIQQILNTLIARGAVMNVNNVFITVWGDGMKMIVEQHGDDELKKSWNSQVHKSLIIARQVKLTDISQEIEGREAK